jgi:hypothetical protein
LSGWERLASVRRYVRYQRGSTGRAGRISNANFLVAL